MSLRIINFKNNKDVDVPIKLDKLYNDGMYTDHGGRTSGNVAGQNMGNTDSASCITLGSIIVQCGNFDTNTVTNGQFKSNRSFEVTFPKPFPNKCLAVVATTAEFNTSVTHTNGPQLITLIQGWDKSKFRVMADSASNDMTRNAGISWIAIGY